MTEKHAQTLASILAPLVADRRANPVLFDRVTFPDLMSLTGDVGGRAIFSKYPVIYLPWHDESLVAGCGYARRFGEIKESGIMTGEITAILLAAGESRRMGQPKMLLPWGETSVLGQVVSIFSAGLITNPQPVDPDLRSW